MSSEMRSTKETLAELKAELAKGEGASKCSVEMLIDEIDQGIASSRRAEAFECILPSRREWLAALVGAALSGSITPEALAQGTIAGIAGSRIVDIAWREMREWMNRDNVFTSLDLEINPEVPEWRNDYNLSDTDLREISGVVKDIVKDAHDLWREEMNRTEQRMHDAVYRRAARDVFKSGAAGDLSRRLI